MSTLKDLNVVVELQASEIARLTARIAEIEAGLVTLSTELTSTLGIMETMIKEAVTEAHPTPAPVFVPNKARARLIAMQLRTHAGYGSAFVTHTPHGYVLTLNASDAEALNKPNLHTQGAMLRPEKVESILEAAAQAAA